MRSDDGFTLLELMVALVVTGVVALLAYGAANAGFSTSDRLQRYQSTVEAQAIVRSLLLDALRHPPEGGGAAMNDVLFAMDESTTGDGVAVDRVRFVSRGLVPPLGASDRWAVSLGAAEAGVRLTALPVGATDAAVDMILAGVHGLDARVLDRSADSVWLDRWEVTGRVPAAVALAFLTERGEPIGAPLVVHSALEAVP